MLQQLPHSHSHLELPPSHLKCPNCGRHTIVMHGDGRYVCLSCDWFRDLNDEQQYHHPRKSTFFWLVAIVILLILWIRR